MKIILFAIFLANLAHAACNEILGEQLATAIWQHKTDLAKDLLKQGACPDGGPANQYNDSYPLCVAAKDGQNDMVEELLNSGAKIEGPSKRNSDTPLRCAIKGKHLDLVKFLIAKGANISDVYPMIAAARANDLPIVQYLISAGAPVQTSPKYATVQPLGEAVKNGNAAIVNRLLNAGANAHCALSIGLGDLYETPLHREIRKSKSKLSIITDLLDHGAEVNYTDLYALLEEPIRYAIRGDQLNVVNLLISRGAKVPSHSICDLKENFEIAKILLSHGESAKILCQYNRSVLFRKISGPLIKFLIQQGADINAVDSDGETALEWNAVMPYNENAKKVIIDHGPDMSIPSHQRTFFTWAPPVSG